MALTDTQRGIAGFGFLSAKAVGFFAIPASMWFHFAGDTLKAIYWIVRSLALCMATRVAVLDDPDGDAEYAAFLKSQQK